MTVARLKLRAVLDILRHFENRWLVIAMRLGLVRVPYFPFRIRQNGASVTMLGRPANVSMGDLFVLRELFIEETYRELLSVLPPGAIRVVDVGANLGSFVVWLHRRHGIRAAHCFEPEPTSFQLCRLNLAENGCAGATAIHAALGGESRLISLSGKHDQPGGVSIYGSGDDGKVGATQVRVIAFKDWLAENPGEFDVLKLDCEGAEWEILEHTAPSAFQRFRIVVAEVHEDAAGKRRVEEFPRMLEERGFRTLRWDGHSHGLYLGIQRDAKQP